jgi:hypothetical protein
MPRVDLANCITRICENCPRVGRDGKPFICPGATAHGCPLDLWPEPLRTHWINQNRADRKARQAAREEEMRAQELAAQQSRAAAKQQAREAARLTEYQAREQSHLSHLKAEKQQRDRQPTWPEPAAATSPLRPTADTPQIAVLCPSYNRPRLLGHAIAMFEAQRFLDAEMIALEDSGAFPRDREGTRWKIVTTSTKIKTVGAKRNLLATMTAAPYLAVMDDDDIYLPWWLESLAHALDRYLWVRPTQALEWSRAGEVYRCLTHGARDRDPCYGGQWAYRRETFLASPQYPLIGNGDDGVFGYRMRRMFGQSGDSICPEYPDPFYVYQRQQTQSWHASEMGDGTAGLRAIHALPQSQDEFKIELPDHYHVTIPTELLPRPWK